ncbi:hypothetical protein PHJA_002385400 [Phtheirospermum japonicum]|uniref:Uncharacterized protein n=1 Tax=Phtheirospermum japonicum TaxID=374723 RepID=A0A830D1Y3_9LAMI|nr:hypothetical protein PHJA_002385400 [Phtheirospermum japonicum]
MCIRSRQIIPGLLRRCNRFEEECNRFEKELKRKRSREKLLLVAMVVSWIMFYVFK